MAELTTQQMINLIVGAYGKTWPQLQAQAKRHWKEWRPKMYKDLQDRNYLQEETKKAAKRARKEITELMEAGYRYHEAEEVVLPKYILLEPEPEVTEEWERLAAMPDVEDDEEETCRKKT